MLFNLPALAYVCIQGVTVTFLGAGSLSCVTKESRIVLIVQATLNMPSIAVLLTRCCSHLDATLFAPFGFSLFISQDAFHLPHVSSASILIVATCMDTLQVYTHVP